MLCRVGPSASWSYHRCRQVSFGGTGNATATPIRTLRKSLASGGDVLLAVNVDRGSITAQFDIHDLSAGSVAVMFEHGRRVAVANSSFTDSFESMDVHVYRLKT